MSIFDAYDAEFSALKQEIAKNVAEFREDTGAPKPKLIEGLFLQANDLIKQMEIEARSSDSSSRKILNEKVSKYKKSVQTLKSEYNIIKTQHDKSDLINAEPKSKSAEQRQRLLDSNDRVQRQNELISSAHRTVSETEEVGMEIASELARNREKIESSRAKAAEYSGITDSARRLISSISRRESRQKFTAIFILVVLVVVVILIVYYRSR